MKKISNLAEILDVNAIKYGSKIAFKCGNEELSYTEMATKTSQLASFLTTSGVKKGDRVGVYLERSIETVLSIYGIMKAGGVFVPLDPSAPQSRILYLLNDCNIEYLITSKIQQKKVTNFLNNEQPLISVIGIDTESDIASTNWNTIFNIKLDSYRPVKILDTDLAYIMYTSGSTGAPKGIMHTHKSGLSYARLSSQLYSVTDTDKFANHSPLHFDISTFGYFTIPYSGGSTVILKDSYIVFPASLANLLEKERISIWYSVPLALIQLLEKGDLEGKDFSNLRWVLFAGEVFITKHLQELVKTWSNANFSNIYGPAETNQCTYYHFDNKKPVEDPLPLGSIWDETEYLIFDTNKNKAAINVLGELYVHSSTMMKGYWNNTALTERSFYTDPESNKTYFKTGDLVKQKTNERLYFYGRNDFQVKIRGYRVEINEVESLIANHPEVGEAAVFTINKQDLTKELAVAVLTKKESNIDKISLLNYCKSKLPHYSVPQKLFFVENFPRTSSGKINRKELKNKLEPLDDRSN